MILAELSQAIAAIAQDPALMAEQQFAERYAAIDALEFHILQRLADLPPADHDPAELLALQRAAEHLKGALEAVDDALFRRLRAAIGAGEQRGAALAALIDAYAGPDATGRRPLDAPGYDSLDVFINRLLLTGVPPAETTLRDPEMVAYQQTPARVICALVERAQLTPRDRFYDLGSGLGQVPMLVHLLSGAPAWGVELDPALCAYAQSCAAALDLPGVCMLNADARTVDYAGGTVFFLYTPFTGGVLRAVLGKLQAVAQQRPIRLFSYGPGTAQLACEAWLQGEEGAGAGQHRLAAFSSR